MTNLHAPRVANSDTLRELIETAQKHEFNRYPAGLNLDPKGTHVVTVVLPYHQRMFKPDNASPDPEHHRTRVQVKEVRKSEPTTVFLDVTARDFEGLITADQFKTALARA